MFRTALALRLAGRSLASRTRDSGDQSRAVQTLARGSGRLADLKPARFWLRLCRAVYWR